MVRVGGFEPPTAWFVARYSIQLSYTREIWVLVTCCLNGARGRIRTSDRLVRSQVLYPAELHAHSNITLIDYGADGRIRTSDRLVRSQVLYPAELHPHRSSIVRNGGEGGIRTLDGS
jgi:hypothetical protein